MVTLPPPLLRACHIYFSIQNFLATLETPSALRYLLGNALLGNTVLRNTELGNVLLGNILLGNSLLGNMLPRNLPLYNFLPGSVRDEVRQEVCSKTFPKVTSA